MNEVDVAVIGRGMIGSAAARHLGEAGHTVALIGSGEPADYASATAPLSSHYDAGRITRISSPNPIWSELAARSISRYADIADRSGIAIHDGRGLAQASLNTQAAIDNANARGGSARAVDREWLRATTGIEIRADHSGDLFYEEAPAGVIYPRALVAAQTQLAHYAGVTLIDAPATAITRSGSAASVGFTIEAGATIEAQQVLLATGAYGASLVGVDLAIQRRLRTITLAELGPGTEIPSLIDDDPAHSALDGIYWVPPLVFPDGRTWLKIGGDSLPMITAETDADISAWFAGGGSQAEADALADTVRALLPDAEITGWNHKPCVVTYTEPSLPFLGFVDDGVAVALGASGSGAKSSDEIGRLAATLMSPRGWNDAELDLASFTPQVNS